MIVNMVDCKWNETNSVANRDPMYVDVKGKRSFEKVCLIWLTGPNRKAKLIEIRRLVSRSVYLQFYLEVVWHRTYLVIIIRLPTEKKMQNFLAFRSRKGMYIDEMRKQERPEPKQTAKQINLWVAVSLNVNRFHKLGPLVVVSSLISDLKEYCELNILYRVYYLLGSAAR